MILRTMPSSASFPHMHISALYTFCKFCNCFLHLVLGYFTLLLILFNSFLQDLFEGSSAGRTREGKDALFHYANSIPCLFAADIKAQI